MNRPSPARAEHPSSAAPALPPAAAPARPRLALVPAPAPAAAPRRSLLQLWHLLSLDAPTVAAVWVLFIAGAAGVTLRWTAPAAMFVAVWMLYAADRLLDARALAESSSVRGLEERHRFHFEHRRGFRIGIVAASVMLSLLLHKLNPHALHLFAVLAALLSSWLLLIHAGAAPSSAAHRLPKELAVGLFFPAAVFIPTVARVPALRRALLPAAALFAAVCTLNCLYIYAWEHDAEHGAEHSTAHWTTRWATRRLSGLTVAVAALGVGLSLWTSLAPRTFTTLPSTSGVAILALASASAAALLLLLHALRRLLSPLTLRASADLALLTPLLWLPLLLRLPR